MTNSTQDFFTEQPVARKLNSREQEFLANRKAAMQEKVIQSNPKVTAITIQAKGGELLDQKSFGDLEIDTTEVDLTLEVNRETGRANFAAMRKARKQRIVELAKAHAKEDAAEYEAIYSEELNKTTGEGVDELAG